MNSYNKLLIPSLGLMIREDQLVFPLNLYYKISNSFSLVRDENMLTSKDMFVTKTAQLDAIATIVIDTMGIPFDKFTASDLNKVFSPPIANSDDEDDEPKKKK